MAAYWLMKSEPDVFSIEDLKREKESGWEGVRNYQARNFMRDEMKVGDKVLFYHSNAEPSGVAGIAEVASAPVPDPTQFDSQSEYYDASSLRAEPRWVMVKVRFVQRFAQVVSLGALKADKALSGMGVLQKGQRLSVMPVTAAHFKRVLALGSAVR
jgi:predicted RNA-binding protein with PUA-like domain